MRTVLNGCVIEVEIDGGTYLIRGSQDVSILKPLDRVETTFAGSVGFVEVIASAPGWLRFKFHGLEEHKAQPSADQYLAERVIKVFESAQLTRLQLETRRLKPELVLSWENGRHQALELGSLSAADVRDVLRQMADLLDDEIARSHI